MRFVWLIVTICFANSLTYDQCKNVCYNRGIAHRLGDGQLDCTCPQGLYGPRCGGNNSPRLFSQAHCLTKGSMSAYVVSSFSPQSFNFSNLLGIYVLEKKVSEEQIELQKNLEAGFM